MTTRREFLIGAAIFVASPLDLLAEDCAVTSRAVQGPYWRPDAPFVTDLRRKGGEELIVRGVLRERRCAPIANAVIDVWQADHLGKYDLDYGAEESFGRARLRTGPRGEYELRTIRPAPYGMRPAHIHFLIAAAGHRQLVTQLYFAGDRHLASDPVRSVYPDLIKEVRRGEVRFDITLA